MRLVDIDSISLPKGFFEKVDNVPKFYEWLNSLPTVDIATQQHWISVQDERPEDLRVVIIHKKWDGEITLGYSYPFGGELKAWMCLKTPYSQYEVPWVGAGHVDYWMPLPDPPQEVQE